MVLVIGAVLIIIPLQNHKTEKSSTRTCGNCGMKIPFNATTCPYCRKSPGFDFGAFLRYSGKLAIKVIPTVIIASIVMGLIAFLVAWH